MEYEALKKALDGLYAYDTGSTDSGIHDEDLRERVQTYLKTLHADERNSLIAKITIELCLSEKALAQGYGPEDAKDFLTWLDEEMGCLIVA